MAGSPFCILPVVNINGYMIAEGEAIRSPTPSELKMLSPEGVKKQRRDREKAVADIMVQLSTEKSGIRPNGYESNILKKIFIQQVLPKPID